MGWVGEIVVHLGRKAHVQGALLWTRAGTIEALRCKAIARTDFACRAACSGADPPTATLDNVRILSRSRFDLAS